MRRPAKPQIEHLAISTFISNYDQKPTNFFAYVNSIDPRERFSNLATQVSKYYKGVVYETYPEYDRYPIWLIMERINTIIHKAETAVRDESTF